MNILYAVSEAFPFAKDGGLGDVAYAFPQTVRKLGQDIRVMMPLYDTIPQKYRDQMELLTNFTLDVAIQPLYCGLYRLVLRGVTYYFVENDVYFMRGKLYGCHDDGARFAFFSKAVCESIRFLDWMPDIVHCNDWQTALVLFYLRDKVLKNPALRPIRTVFTIHNVEYQGDFSYQTLTDVFGLSGVLFSQGTLELDGNVNLMKGAIEIVDCVTTVSPTYAKELAAPDASGLLSQVIADHDVVGIRNGIHEEINPFDSPFVHRPYTVDSVDERVFNKLWMQENMSLRVREETPVLGCVSRLLPRKGFELLVEVLPEFLEQGAELVVCGNGKRDVKEALQQLEARFPEQVAVISYSVQHRPISDALADRALRNGAAPGHALRCGAAGSGNGRTEGYREALRQESSRRLGLCVRGLYPQGPSRGADGRADGLSGRRDLGNLGEALHDPGLLLDSAG